MAPENVKIVDGKEVPPEPDHRTFNENDILGNVKDDNGDVVMHRTTNGKHVD